MPLAAIDDEYVLAEIVGRVEAIREIAAGLFEARISLSAATVGRRRRTAHQHAVRQHLDP